jgi:hypothetical protein
MRRGKEREGGEGKGKNGREERENGEQQLSIVL